jgi:hypothetical protein
VGHKVIVYCFSRTPATLLAMEPRFEQFSASAVIGERRMKPALRLGRVFGGFEIGASGTSIHLPAGSISL